ncbi:MAG: outer membrane beta-barrel protein [Alphaproteobacteria bacterium]|nr:outer membrane beta-barrel protein [Alphaproteobacteria bacterium]
MTQAIRRCLGLLAWATCVGCGAAQAQQIIAIGQDFAFQAQAVQESVDRQPRTEYQPIGIRLGQLLSFDDGPFAVQTASDRELTPLPPGVSPSASGRGLRDGVLDSFLVRPSLEADLVVDDNLYRAEANKDSDQIYILRPTLRLDSDWLVHAVSARIGGELGRHQDFDAEDFNDFFISAGPRFDVDENTTLTLELGYVSSHSARGSTDDLLEGTEPAIDNALNAQANWRYQSDKYSTRMLYRFRQSDARDNGQIERDFLDNRSHDFVFRQGYEFATGTTAWLQPGLEMVNYRQSRDNSGLVRDNQGWTMLAGLTIDRSAVSFVELGLGVMSRSFEQAGQDDFLALAYEARLLWNLTSLLTMDIAAGRTARLKQSTVSPLSVDDSVDLELAWDPSENLIFHATTAFTHSDFETLPGRERDQDVVAAGLNVRYLMSENLYFEARYDYERQQSSQAGNGFRSNIFGLRAGLQL